MYLCHILSYRAILNNTYFILNIYLQLLPSHKRYFMHFMCFKWLTIGIKYHYPSTNPREKQGILQLSQWFKFFLISKYHQCTCQGTIKLEPIKCQMFFIDNLEHVFVIIYSIYFILTVIKGCFKYNFNSESDINGSRIKTQEWKLNLRVVFCSDQGRS